MTLADLKIGQDAVLRTIGGQGELRHHLLDMGLTPGTEVTAAVTSCSMVLFIGQPGMVSSTVSETTSSASTSWPPMCAPHSSRAGWSTPDLQPSCTGSARSCRLCSVCR